MLGEPDTKEKEEERLIVLSSILQNGVERLLKKYGRVYRVNNKW